MLNEFNTQIPKRWLRKRLVVHLLRRLFGVFLTKNTNHLSVVFLVLGITACSSTSSNGNPLLQGMHQPSDEVREGCRIAVHKCTRCHTLDRILTSQVKTPEAWKLYVHRMRLMPGAAITVLDEPKIVHCLASRAADAMPSLEPSGDNQ